MADIKISALPAAGPLTGDELILLSQGGADATMLLSDLPGPAPAGGWVRPADWLPMPETVPGQIDILAAVHNNASNFAGVQCICPSGFVVDWGDGSPPSETTSSATARLVHKYDWGDVDPDTLTSDGHRQVLVKITPRVLGNHLTSVFLYPGLNTDFSGVSANFRCPWLDAQINGPGIIYFNASGGGQLRRVVVKAFGAITSMSNFAYGCVGIESVEFSDGVLAPVTSWGVVGNTGPFFSCTALAHVAFGPTDFDAATSARMTFSGCRAIRDLSFGPNAFALVSGAADTIFQNCSSLERLEFGANAFSLPINAISMFNSCIAMKELIVGVNSFNSVISATQMFIGCSTLTKLSFGPNAFNSVTSSNSMFSGCSELRELSFGPNAFGVASDVGSMFAGCTHLSKITGMSISVSFSLLNCAFGPDELNEVFMALPTVSGRTITITGNWGAATCDTSIATAKGWTVAS